MAPAPDAGHDAGTIAGDDAGTSDDAGSAEDAGTSDDAGSPEQPDAGTIDVDAGPAPRCPPRTYACACATGYYCLRIGAMCLAPTAPCPPPIP